MGKVEEMKASGRPTTHSKLKEAGSSQKQKIDRFTRSAVGNEKEETSSIEKALSVVMEELKGMNEKMGANKEEIKKEFDRLRESIADRDKKWEGEKNSMIERIDAMEEKLRNVEIGERRNMEGDENGMWEEEKQRMQQQQAKIEAEIGRLEQMKQRQIRAEKKNNIVVKGLKGTENELKMETGKMLEEKFGVKIDTKDVWVSGREEKVAVIKLKQWEVKEKIMRNKNKLANTEIYIDHDLTVEEREVQRKIAQAAKVARRENSRVKIGYRKMCVDGKWIRWEEIKRKLEREEEGEHFL